MDTYPEEKDPNNRQGGAAIGGGSSTGGAAEKGNEVLIMNAKNDDRTTSFFSQPGILAGKTKKRKLKGSRSDCYCRMGIIARGIELIAFG